MPARLKADRYQAGGPEAEFEPSSQGRVLRNLVGVRSVREMARHESEALLAATRRLIDETAVDQKFTAKDICRMHRLWLGEIYPWAGEYRQVNITKGDFMFAAAGQIPRLMREFERGPLRKFTPCRYDDIDEQSRALGIVHVELILIHPYREGNGRCARLLAMLMAFQAGLPALDFGGIRGREKQRYIAAIRAGLNHDYEPITGVYRRIIKRTLRSQVTV